MTDSLYLRSQAYQQIRQRLVEGVYAQGSRISDYVLSRELGISRAPIRESLNQLVAEGFLKQKPGLGTFIHTPSRKEIVDLYQLRQWVELSAFTEAIDQLNPTDIKLLEDSCQEIRQLADELTESGETLTPGNSFKRLNEADALFHMTVLRRTGNKLAIKVLRDYRVLEQLWSFYMRPHNAKTVHAICDEHEAILAGLKTRDLNQCSQALSHHLESAEQSSLDIYDSQLEGPESDDFLLT